MIRGSVQAQKFIKLFAIKGRLSIQGFRKLGAFNPLLMFLSAMFHIAKDESEKAYGYLEWLSEHSNAADSYIAAIDHRLQIEGF